MALNPFDLLDQRLQNMEGVLMDIKHNLRPAPTPPDKDQLLNINEAAAFLKMSRAGIYKLCGERKIPNLKKFGKILFSKDELIAWTKEGRRKTRNEINAAAEKHLDATGKKKAAKLSGHKQKVA